MKFPTNIRKRGNYIYIRGYNHGKYFKEIVKYSPYLFVISEEESEYKTIDGKYLKKLNFATIKDANDFIKFNEDIYKIYGLRDWEYLYYYEKYPEGFEYDYNLLNIVSIDIETDSHEGYGNVELADKEITAITLVNKGKSISFGYFDYKSTDDKIYVRCKDEKQLLERFIQIWNTKKWLPDIITGWNCIPKTQNIWGENSICNIEKSSHNLYNSKIIDKSPISIKEKFKIELENGQKFFSSGDHKIPVLSCDSEKYTKLISMNNTKKSFTQKEVLTVKDLENNNNCNFIEVPLRKNNNKNNENYSNEELYLAGLIFTDGSLKDKNRLNDGYTLYQSDLNLLNLLDKFGLNTKISGPYKNSYQRYINKKFLNESHNLIYDNKGKKRFDIETLSTLSYIQFMYFLSGLLDGDGYIGGNNINLCNYNGDELYKIQELLQWNGIFSTIHQNKTKNIIGNILTLIDFEIKDLYLLKEKRWKNFIRKNILKRNNSEKSRQIRFKKIDNSYYVRIKKITNTHEFCEMMDIETDTHLFVSNGMVVHNCLGYDIPYLINRIKRLFDEEMANKLSPFGFIYEKTEIWRNGKVIKTYDICGISHVDYMAAYLKFAKNSRESYKLDYIAGYELGEKKVDYTSYGSLDSLYRNNFDLFMDYNIHDAFLIEKLEEKLHYIQQMVSIAFVQRVNIEQTLKTVKAWDIMIHNFLMDQKIAVPPLKEVTSSPSIMGGYVCNPDKGMYDWVCSIDFTSLYPSLAIQYNISPDTFVTLYRNSPSEEDIMYGDIEKFTKRLLEKNCCMSANGAIFKRDKRGFFPEILKKFFDGRKIYKNKMIEKKQELKEIEKELKKRNIKIDK